MSSSLLSFCDRQSGQEFPERRLPPRPTEQSLAESLKRIVRRVLRTQSQRTGFEARVLEEARRLMDGHYCELARDTLERLVVDRLLKHHDDRRSDLALQGAAALCPVTHLTVHNSTFSLQPACG